MAGETVAQGYPTVNALGTMNVTAVGGSAIGSAVPTYESATDSIIGAASRYRVQSAATNNAAVIKAGSGNVYEIAVSNNKASAIFLKFFDMATTPTPGTDIPIATFLIPIGGHAPTKIIPLAFTVGIAICIVTGKADSDNTAVAADDATGMIAYQ